MLLTLLTNVVISIAILAAAWFGGNWTRDFIKNLKKLDGTLRSFLGGLVKYTIIALAVITVLNQFGVQTASLIAVLGAAGLAIGLALQGTLSNVAAGVMLLILRPFNVGDFIQCNGIMGTVKNLSLFGTELATPDNVYVYAPNSTIWNSDILNFSRNPERRHDLVVGISYSDDINKAFKTIQKTIDAEDRIIKTEGKEPLIAVQNLGGSSVDIKVRIWTAGDHLGIKFDTIKAIKEALDKNGITIPFSTHTIEFSGAAPAELTAGKEEKPKAKKKPAAKKDAA